LGFCSSGTGMDGQKGRLIVILSGKQRPKLQFAYGIFERFQLSPQIIVEFFILQFGEFGRIAQPMTDFLPNGNFIPQVGQFPHDFLGFIGIIPKIWLYCNFLKFSNSVKFGGYVKDASVNDPPSLLIR
jgi:hypothetical protein